MSKAVKHLIPVPESAPQSAIIADLACTGRRRLLSGLAGVALAALTIAMPSDAAAEHPDAELLQLCAEFETLQRKANGVFYWRTPQGIIRGAGYIEDDDERDAAVGLLEGAVFDLSQQIVEMPILTLDGFRAVARCLMLWDIDFRNGATDIGDTPDNLLLVLLRGLAGNDITAATCMDGPAIECDPRSVGEPV